MTTGLILAQIVVDAAEPATLADFYASLLGRPAVDLNPYVSQINGTDTFPALMFIAVPDPRPAKNRLHLDLASQDYLAAVDRAVSLGATKRGEFAEYGVTWVTLADPEGNLFDIAPA